MTALHDEIRVAGSVPAAVLEEMRDVRVITHSVETVLQGPVEDQAALVGIINRLQCWGIELNGIRQLHCADSPADTAPSSPAHDPAQNPPDGAPEAPMGRRP